MLLGLGEPYTIRSTTPNPAMNAIAAPAKAAGIVFPTRLPSSRRR